MDTQYDGVYQARGRVNLIGEHIDYNGGTVLPVAISLGITLSIKKRNDQKFSFYSVNYPQQAPITLALEDDTEGWTKYPWGVFMYTLKNRSIPYGLDLVFEGSIPSGAGLSSSAAIEVVTAVALNDIYKLGLTKHEIVTLAMRVENEYIGVQTGIMDQFAIVYGKQNQALHLNTRTLEFEYVPFKMSGVSLIVMNTNKSRALVESKYDERVLECQTALKTLQKSFHIDTLAQLNVDDLEIVESRLQHPRLFGRVKHVVTENQRVHASIEALKQGDMVLFGKAMNESHRSLRDDYEVTGIELDTLVDAALSYQALGARVTGAGFGGCAIALVEDEHVASFISNVTQKYEAIIGYAPHLMKVEVVDGICTSQPFTD